MWEDIGSIVIKTVLSIQPQLKHQYRSCMAAAKNGDFCCFEILGFDIFLDEKLSPWLLEVNHSPSFNTDTLLDRVVKTNLLTETMKLLAINPKDRIKSRKIEKAKAMERIKGKSNVESTSNAEPVGPTREEVHARHDKMEDEIMVNYYRIYPVQGYEKYDQFIEFSLKMAQRAGDPLALSAIAKSPTDVRIKSGSSTARPKSSLSQQPSGPTKLSTDSSSTSPRTQSALGDRAPTSPRTSHLLAPLSPRSNPKPKPIVQSRYMSAVSLKTQVERQQKGRTHELRLPKPTTLVLDLPFNPEPPRETKKPPVQPPFQVPTRRLVTQYIMD
jgi:tubulin polyglutamylase TTLL6/13